MNKYKRLIFDFISLKKKKKKTHRYIIGSKTAHALGSWRYALRVTPFLGLIAVVLIYFSKEPERGQHEGSHTVNSSYKKDLTGK